MREMKELRAYELSARDLGEMVANQEVSIITIGRSRVARLFVLPLGTWRETIAGIYGEDAENDVRRVSTRTTRDELDERTMMAILMNQVDENWQPHQFAILTQASADAAYLVPANEYWQKQVESETENGNR